MADQQQQSGAISAAFPAPPPFYKHFTEQNLSRLKELQQKAQSDGTSAIADFNAPSASNLLDLPPELRFLIPPEPPSSGLYRSFGDQYNASIPFTSSRLCLSSTAALTNNHLVKTDQRPTPHPRRPRHHPTLPLPAPCPPTRHLDHSDNDSHQLNLRMDLRPRLPPPQTRQIPAPQLPRTHRHAGRQPGALRPEDRGSADVVHQHASFD